MTKNEARQQATPPLSQKSCFDDYNAFVADAAARQAPPPPGMGVLVDKTV
jgi:hypothetical protein